MTKVQFGGMIEERDAKRLDLMVAETETTRTAVLRAMIRMALSDEERFLGEWMPPFPEGRFWEIGGDPYPGPGEVIRLREVTRALEWASNPDDFKPEVRTEMWKQALESIAQHVARTNRVYRENVALEAEIQRLRAMVPEEQRHA